MRVRIEKDPHSSPATRAAEVGELIQSARPSSHASILGRAGFLVLRLHPHAGVVELFLAPWRLCVSNRPLRTGNASSLRSRVIARAKEPRRKQRLWRERNHNALRGLTSRHQDAPPLSTTEHRGVELCVSSASPRLCGKDTASPLRRRSPNKNFLFLPVSATYQACPASTAAPGCYFCN